MERSDVMKEFVISTNAFELPKILEGNEAEYTLIIRLLLLEPGTNQNHPDMGIGIRSRYQFSDTSDINNLSTEIKNQMDQFAPQLLATTVELQIIDSVLVIFITTDSSQTYGIGFNTETGEIGGLRLSDL